MSVTFPAGTIAINNKQVTAVLALPSVFLLLFLYKIQKATNANRVMMIKISTLDSVLNSNIATESEDCSALSI